MLKSWNPALARVRAGAIFSPVAGVSSGLAALLIGVLFVQRDHHERLRLQPSSP